MTSSRIASLLVVVLAVVAALAMASGGAAAGVQLRAADVQITTVAANGSANATAPIPRDATLTVSGVTNRDPDRANVLVSLRATNGTAARLTQVETWDADGRWAATLNASGLSPGAYTVTATTGDATSVREVRIAAASADESATANGTGEERTANGTAEERTITTGSMANGTPTNATTPNDSSVDLVLGATTATTSHASTARSGGANGSANTTLNGTTTMSATNATTLNGSMATNATTLNGSMTTNATTAAATSSTTGAGSPGFGASLGVAALMASCLLARVFRTRSA
ncbi:hypothetical protein [Halarchaeum acidiphilum]|uniref:hypothetical protein n=1 Tax=Halarchaeum acidiphilum TaxID=489138 RepID=UPI0011DD4828|nr:hypothetical protein [Halarchaeum acidiphilum]